MVTAVFVPFCAGMFSIRYICGLIEKDLRFSSPFVRGCFLLLMLLTVNIIKMSFRPLLCGDVFYCQEKNYPKKPKSGFSSPFVRGCFLFQFVRKFNKFKHEVFVPFCAGMFSIVVLKKVGCSSAICFRPLLCGDVFYYPSYLHKFHLALLFSSPFVRGCFLLQYQRQGYPHTISFRPLLCGDVFY